MCLWLRSGIKFRYRNECEISFKKLEIEADIDHTTISEANAFKSDMILTQKAFADVLNADATPEQIKRVIILNKLTDKAEIEQKIVAFLKERNVKVANHE